MAAHDAPSKLARSPFGQRADWAPTARLDEHRLSRNTMDLVCAFGEQRRPTALTPLLLRSQAATTCCVFTPRVSRDGLSTSAFPARLGRNRRYQLLHASALAGGALDAATIVFADAEIQLRLLATIQAFIFVRRHLMTSCLEGEKVFYASALFHSKSRLGGYQVDCSLALRS